MTCRAGQGSAGAGAGAGTGAGAGAGAEGKSLRSHFRISVGRTVLGLLGHAKDAFEASFPTPCSPLRKVKVIAWFAGLLCNSEA